MGLVSPDSSVTVSEPAKQDFVVDEVEEVVKGIGSDGEEGLEPIVEGDFETMKFRSQSPITPEADLRG